MRHALSNILLMATVTTSLLAVSVQSAAFPDDVVVSEGQNAARVAFGPPHRLGGGLKPVDKSKKHFVVTTPMPHEILSAADVPRNWDWRNVSGVNYVSSSRNQHIPVYCGSCWTQATTSSLADRIRIQRNARFPDYMIPAQVIVYCVPDGCAGGDPDLAHAYIHQNGIGPDTCQMYVAQGSGFECSPLRRCMDCSWTNNSCNAVENYPKFGISEFGNVLGVPQMKAEIFARGPIACGIDCAPIDGNWGWGPDKDKIFTGGAGFLSISHEIAVVGFGYDPEEKMDYWIIRNSWGEYWGDTGFFRLKMGDNLMNIEGNACSWAVPTIPPELM